MTSTSTLASRRVWVSTLLAYGLSQAVILLGSVVRIPMLSGALGERGYGTFVIVTSLWPAVQLLSGGLAGAARVWVAGHQGSSGTVVRALRRTGTVEAITVLAITAAVLPLLGRWVETPVLWSLACVSAGAAVVLPLSAHRGVLEGHGHTAASHLALSTVTIVGLPVLVLALSWEPSLLSAVIATMIGFIAPTLTYRLLTSWLTPLRPASAAGAEPPPQFSLRALTGAMTGWGLANILVFLFDPLIIGVTTGAEAAAQYGLASRITGLVTAVPEALGALLVVWFTQLRTGDGAGVMARLRLALLIGVIFGIGLAVVSAVLGPHIGDFLGRGQVGTPRELYVWWGIYGGLTCAAEPLVAAWAAPRAAPIRARTGMLLGVVNVALSFVLAWHLGVLGPIIATVICNALIVLHLVVLTVRRPELITRNHGLTAEERT